jgi:hypothetical protein
VAQGLSDFRKAELPKLGGMLEDRCPLYRLKKDDSVPAGENARQPAERALQACRYYLTESCPGECWHSSVSSLTLDLAARVFPWRGIYGVPILQTS